MNDSLFGSLISDVVNHRSNASISFYTNLTKFYSAALSSENPTKTLVDLIQFITQWCQISDGFATRILIDNLQYLLPPTDDQNQVKANLDLILQSFSKLIQIIIEELGSFIYPQLQQFISIFRPRVQGKSFDEFVFPTLFSIIELDQTLSDSVATTLRFVSNFLDMLSEPNIQRLIEKIKHFSDSHDMHIRLAVIDTFPLFCAHEPTLFETVFLKFFNDSDTIIKSHFIQVITSHFSNKINILIPFATDANWKLRYSYIENCSKFIATDKEVEDIFYQIAHYDPEIVLRAQALHRLATCEDLKIEVKVERAIAEEKEELYKSEDKSEPEPEAKSESEATNENEIKVYDNLSSNDQEINLFESISDSQSQKNLNSKKETDDSNPTETPKESDQTEEAQKAQETEPTTENNQEETTNNIDLRPEGEINSEGNIIVHSSSEKEGENDLDDSSSSSSSSSGEEQSLVFGFHANPAKPSTTFSSISPLNSGGASFTSNSILAMNQDPNYLTVFKNDEKLMNLCKSNKYVSLCINSLCSKYKHLRISGCELACKLQVTALCFRRAVFQCVRTQRELEVIMKGYIPYCRWNEGTRFEQCVLSVVRESLRNPDWRTALSALTCISLFLTDKVRLKRSRRNSILKSIRRYSNTSTNDLLSPNPQPEVEKSGFSVETASIKYGNAFLALKLFGEVLLRIESPNFCVRQEAVEQIINFVKCFGWEFYLERVHTKVIGFTKSNRIRTQRISVRILRKMLKLNPPEDIKQKIVSILEPIYKLMEE